MKNGFIQKFKDFAFVKSNSEPPVIPVKENIVTVPLAEPVPQVPVMCDQEKTEKTFRDMATTDIKVEQNPYRTLCSEISLDKTAKCVLTHADIAVKQETGIVITAEQSPDKLVIKLPTSVETSMNKVKEANNCLGIIEVKRPMLIAPVKERMLLSSPPIVSFDKVTKKFGEKIAIQDVSFEVHDKVNSGELISIVGPSGCGKSTILRILAGLTPQFPTTSGSVRVFGKEVTGSGSDRGVVDQKYSLLPNLRVWENISFGLSLRGVGRSIRKEKAMEWVKKIGLEGSENKFPHELSGGMQQRVSLAATLILHPKILLMDEPFGALDPKTRLKMQELLIELWKELEATVFIVTHSMEEAVYLGDRVFRMEANPGRLVEILDVPRPNMSPEEMRKKKWFNEIVQELLRRIETGSPKTGDLYKKKKTDKDLNEDELELFKLIG